MSRKLYTAIIFTGITLTQAACLFGGRTPLDPSENNTQCTAAPACSLGYTQAPACPNDGRECKPSSICGSTIYCVKDEQPCDLLPDGAALSCPPSYIEVDHCPTNGPEECRTITDGCQTTYCLAAPCEEAPPQCPDDYIYVGECDPDQEDCVQIQGACGLTHYCQYLPVTCDAEPVCPEGTAPVTNCADPGLQCEGCEDGSCTEVSACGSTLICKKADCSPQQAQGFGACRALLGYRWDGQACQAIGGCECRGADCQNLHQDVESCERANAACEPQQASCGPHNNAYFPTDVATIGGYAWDGQQCVALLGGGPCQGPDCPFVYNTHQGCKDAFAHCEGPSPCEGQDAEGIGFCDAYFGTMFDGRQCVSVSGCSCRGADCQNLYMDRTSCERDNISCLAD